MLPISLSSNPSAIIVSTCCLLGAILNVAYFAESMARRKLVLGGFFVSGMSMLAIGIAFVLPDVALAKRRLVLTAFASVVGFCDSASVSNIALAIANEIPAQEYRSASMVYHWVTYFVATAVHDVVQPYWINVTSLNLGGKVSTHVKSRSILVLTKGLLIRPRSVAHCNGNTDRMAVLCHMLPLHRRLLLDHPRE